MVETDNSKSLTSFKVCMPMRKPAVKYWVKAMMRRLPTLVNFNNERKKDVLRILSRFMMQNYDEAVKKQRTRAADGQQQTAYARFRKCAQNAKYVDAPTDIKLFSNNKRWHPVSCNWEQRFPGTILL